MEQESNPGGSDIRALSIASVLVAASLLAACGGGGESSRPTVSPPLPTQGVQHARQSPIIDLGGTLHVGADVAPPARFLRGWFAYPGIRASNGEVRDGIGADTLISYLQEDAAENAYGEFPEGLLARFGETPPTVLVAAGATPELFSDVVHAIQLINASLPAHWQLRLSAFPALAGLEEVPEGEIHVEFAAYGDWPSSLIEDQREGGCFEAVGCASGSWSDAIRSNNPENPRVFEYVSAKTWIDHTQSTGPDRLETVVHEFIHTLGRNHPDPTRFPETIMRVEDETGRMTGAAGVPGHMLHPLDREALLAVYDRLEPSDTPAIFADELGLWMSETYHIRGEIEAVDGAAFGVAYRNYLSQPWASGPTPWTNLVDNAVLSGTVSWDGLMMGFDRHTGDHVLAATDLEIDLGSLAGVFDFFDMRAWEAPNLVRPDTGTVWGDGDLAYTVGVRGNTFVQTGGDAGIVTGAFFGAQHEGMGGTLVRADLTAAFGGSR